MADSEQHPLGRRSREGADPDAEVGPDGKEWTWVLAATCPECDLTVGNVDPKSVAWLVPDQVARWNAVLSGSDVAVRPRPGVWSPLEYACHVRDAYGVFAARTELLLDEDWPTFAAWDQDAAAVVGRYGDQTPGEVARELAAAAAEYVDLLGRVPDGAWGRVGLRSNGSEFTLATLTQYFLHDAVHHLRDVNG